MRAIAYVRVSSVEQSKGLSLDWQREQCFVAIRSRGWELVDLAADTASGKALKHRAGLQGALARLEAGEADVLVVARLDRLSRSALDFYDLLARADKASWSLLCLSPLVDMTDPFGRMVAGVAAVFAQFERELISQRQLESVRARKAAGTWRSPLPAVSPAATRRIMHLSRQGLSSAEIAQRLQLEGFPAPRADVWPGRTVRRVVARGRNGSESF